MIIPHYLIYLSVDIEDPIELFANGENALLDYLRVKFESSCCRDCYVVRINSILKQSLPLINMFGDPSFATIDLCLDIVALKYVPGEILVGCRILEVDKDDKNIPMLIAQLPHASVMFHERSDDHPGTSDKRWKITELFSPGDFAIGQVDAVRYQYGNPVALFATLYEAPTRRNMVIHKIPAFTAQKKTALHGIVGEIREELRQKAALTPPQLARWQMFDKFMHSVSDKDIPAIDLLNLAENGTAEALWLAHDPRLNTADGKVAVCEKTKTAPQCSANEGLLELLNYYHQSLRVLREMVETYDSAAKIKQHSNLWMYLKQQKQSS